MSDSKKEERFLELIRNSRGRLRRLCRIYAPGPADREDLYQDILVEAWRSLETFRGDASPETWLYRVALNTALARRRKEDRRREAHQRGDPDVSGAKTALPDEDFEKRQRADRLYEAIAGLDEMDRAVVLLYMEDFSYSEISEVVGITPNYVGVKLHRIREELAESLAEEAA